MPLNILMDYRMIAFLHQRNSSSVTKRRYIYSQPAEFSIPHRYAKRAAQGRPFWTVLKISSGETSAEQHQRTTDSQQRQGARFRNRFQPNVVDVERSGCFDIAHVDRDVELRPA